MAGQVAGFQLLEIIRNQVDWLVDQVDQLGKWGKYLLDRFYWWLRSVLISWKFNWFAWNSRVALICIVCGTRATVGFPASGYRTQRFSVCTECSLIRCAARERLSSKLNFINADVMAWRTGFIDASLRLWVVYRKSSLFVYLRKEWRSYDESLSRSGARSGAIRWIWWAIRRTMLVLLIFESQTCFGN